MKSRQRQKCRRGMTGSEVERCSPMDGETMGQVVGPCWCEESREMG